MSTRSIITGPELKYLLSLFAFESCDGVHSENQSRYMGHFEAADSLLFVI